MRLKWIAGLIVLIIGVILMLTASHIREKVREGRGEIRSAQKKVDTASSLMSQQPVAKEVGKGITGPMQGKINEGSREADYYENVAMWLNIGGIVLIIVGIGGILLGLKKGKH